MYYCIPEVLDTRTVLTSVITSINPCLQQLFVLDILLLDIDLNDYFTICTFCMKEIDTTSIV